MRWIREHRLFSTVAGIVIVLIMIIVGSYISGGTNVLGKGVHRFISAVEKPFTYVAGNIQDGFNGIFKYKSLQEENEKLREENEELKQKNINLAISNKDYEELKKLAETFNFEPFNGIKKAVVGNIIFMDNSMVYREFTIDVGTDKGVLEGDIVVDSNGLVGVVKDASKNTAKISSILDINNNISFMVKRDMSVLGVLKGKGKSKLEGYLLDEKANIIEGDTLITSGMGHYPKGIVVGKVSKVEYDSDTQLKRVEVRPTFNLKSMQKVAIFK